MKLCPHSRQDQVTQIEGQGGRGNQRDARDDLRPDGRRSPDLRGYAAQRPDDQTRRNPRVGEADDDCGQALVRSVQLPLSLDRLRVIGQPIGQIITEQGADLIAIHFRQSFGRIIATLAMARMGSFAVDFISSCAMGQLEEKRRCPVKMS